MKDNKYRWFMIGILLVLLVMLVSMIWYFTSQSGQVSHSTSMNITSIIENTLRKYYAINFTDHFWRYTLDELVRKGAHFSEYLLLGIITFSLFSLLLLRVWSTAVISLIICAIYAGIDEYRQSFIAGRTSRWFDWKVDVSGAFVGILMALIVFLIFRYISNLKARIKELELGNFPH